MKKYKYSLFLLIIDFILLNSSYFVMNYFKRGTFTLSPAYYIKLLIAFNLIWITVSLVMNKFSLTTYEVGLKTAIKHLIKSAIINCYIVSIMVVGMGLFAFSRLHIFGTISLILSAEILILWGYHIGHGKQAVNLVKDKDVSIRKSQRISARLLFADFFIINLSFFIITYIKYGSFQPEAGYEMLLLMLYGLWFVTSIATRKFNKDGVYDFSNAMVSCLKSVILITAIMALLIFTLRLQHFFRNTVFGTLALSFVFEIFLYGFYVVNRKEKASTKDIESIEQVQAYFEKEREINSIKIADVCIVPEDPVQEKLKTALDFFNPWLFNLINSRIDLSNICKSKTCILKTNDLVNIEVLDDNNISLIINLYKLNHFRRINEYFLEIHRKLEAGGFFIGKANTIRTYKEKVEGRYPKYFSIGLYALHFLFFRIFPKLPFTRQMYFVATQGRNRIISRAEVLGRLQFCGFDIIAEQELDFNLYFIARKTKIPSNIKNPSYGPLVQMNRIGAQGKPIKAYKFRTMYPYSEFLQEYVHNLNNLQEGGKFNNDFRVTAWGKFMRKLWLDELPMLYNWLRGDLQLVGVRPLSFQYLSLYHKDLQIQRSFVKPGLIPPFYVDLPKTFDEICESERQYIQSYLKKPLRTQWAYFWKACYNIVVKGARSN